MSFDIGEATERIFLSLLLLTTHSPTLPLLYLRHSSFSNPSVALPTSQLILQLCRCFTYVTVHSPTLLSLLIRHRLFTYDVGGAIYTVEKSSFSNLSVTSPTSQLILQHLRRFTYVTAHSTTLPLHLLHHSSFFNPSFASPTSQARHLIHLVSSQCSKRINVFCL